jgi:DNA-binding transcriptional MerR regulator
MNNATGYTVGEVSQRTGFTIDTLRYYERLGLIERIERTTGGKRRYRADREGRRVGHWQRSEGAARVRLARRPLRRLHRLR